MNNQHNKHDNELNIVNIPKKPSYESEFNKIIDYYQKKHDKWIPTSFGWEKDTCPVYKRVLEHLLANENMPVEDLENYFQLFIKQFCSKKPFSVFSMFNKENPSDIIDWTISTLGAFERYQTRQDLNEIAQYFGLFIDYPKNNLKRYYSRLVNKLTYYVRHSITEQEHINSAKPFIISSKDCFNHKLYNMQEFPMPLKTFKATYAND